MSEDVKIDANELLQRYMAAGIDPQQQAAKVGELLNQAQPWVLVVAEGAKNLPPAAKVQAQKEVAALLQSIPDETDRDGYLRLAAEYGGFKESALRGALRTSKKAAEEKDEESEPVYTTGGWYGGGEWLLELYFDEKEQKTFFAVRKPSGEISIMHKVTIDGIVYRPQPVNSIIAKKLVRLPNRLPDHLPSERELNRMMATHQHKYFDFGSNDFYEDLSPLWAMHSYVYDGFTELSYLRGLGDYGTGKTRFIKTIGFMCYRPIYITGGSSAASLYHLIDKYRGTVVLNEADFDKSDESSIIAKILNGGTERDEAITKMKKTPDGNMDIEAYNVYCPKVIATRKSFNDRAISSRCLTMEMIPLAPRPDIPQSIPPEFEQEALEIRNYMTLFRLQNAKPNFEVDQSLTDRQLEGRLNQITLALLTTIKNSEMRTQIQRFLREYNEQERSSRYDTMTARILEGIIRAWAWGPVSERSEDDKRIYMKDIAHATNQITNEMNRRVGDDEGEDDDGKDDGKDGKYRKKEGKKLTSRGISESMTKYLQLRTFRATDGMAEYKGTKFVDMAKDETRIRALCERWGVEWKNAKSMSRPVLVVMPKDGSGNLSEGEKSGQAFAEERAKWEALQKSNREESAKVHAEQTQAFQAKRAARQLEVIDIVPEEPPDWHNLTEP